MLVSNVSLSYFQVWVMILIAVKTFLRYDELYKIKLEGFVEDLCIVQDDGFVDVLAFQIQVKNEIPQVTLSSFADILIPELCRNFVLFVL